MKTEEKVGKLKLFSRGHAFVMAVVLPFALQSSLALAGDVGGFMAESGSTRSVREKSIGKNATVDTAPKMRGAHLPGSLDMEDSPFSSSFSDSDQAENVKNEAALAATRAVAIKAKRGAEQTRLKDAQKRETARLEAVKKAKANRRSTGPAKKTVKR